MKQTSRQKSCFCVEYWLLRGYTEEQAKLEISKRQSRGRDHFKTQEDYERYRDNLKKSKNTEEFKKNQSIAIKKSFTEQHWIDKLGEEEGKKKYLSLIEKSRKSLIKVRESLTKEEIQKNSIFCIPHWISKGFTKEEAIEKIKLLQSRGKSFFIEKYGEKDGLERWKQRTKNWRNSFEKNDQDAINQKRKDNASEGRYTENFLKYSDLKVLNFYLLKFKFDNEEFLKFGLTKQKSITKRWGSSKKNYYDILIFKEMNALEAFKLEQKIKNDLKQHKFVSQNIKTTEALDIICLNEVYKIIGN